MTLSTRFVQSAKTDAAERTILVFLLNERIRSMLWLLKCLIFATLQPSHTSRK